MQRKALLPEAPPDSKIEGKPDLPENGLGRLIFNMTPQALHLEASAIPMAFDYIIFSADHGLISEHIVEEEARAAFESFIAEVEMGEYLPLLLRRSGDDWEFA